MRDVFLAITAARRTLILVSAGLLAPGTLAATTVPCAYDVTEISGPVHPLFGDSFLMLYDMNDAGVAVGSYRWLNPFPCTWTEAEGIKTIQVPPGILYAEAIRINNNAWILASGQEANGAYRGFVLIPNGDGWTWVEMLPVTANGWSYVSGINDMNEVVGAESVGSPGSAVYPLEGFLWSASGGKVGIQISGWNATQCIDINASGIICGNVSQSGAASAGTEGTRGFVLDGDAVTIVEPPSPWSRAELRRINALSEVAGNVYTPQQGSETDSTGFVFDATTGSLTLIDPPNGYFRWTVRDVSDCSLMCGTVVDIPKPYTPLLCAASGSGVSDLTLSVPKQFSEIAGGGGCIRSDGVILAQCACYGALLCQPSAEPADLDCDGLVGPSDLAEVLSVWGQCGPAADINGDGAINGADIGVRLSKWTVGQ
ncbi:MAG: hypothetical protein U0575_02230 [Phycisphaerales bacterium]|jgi:hypothetical protein